MPEDLLQALDAAFARERTRTILHHDSHGSRDDHDAEVDADDQAVLLEEDTAGRWGTIELLVVAQYAMSALLFIPGTQGIRPIIRAMPYVASLALLVLSLRRRVGGSMPAGARLLLGAIALLGVNLLHPTSGLMAGLGQIVFQLSIAGPIFWCAHAVRSSKQAVRLLVLVFLFNGVSAGLGVMQVYYPDRFLPPQFSTTIENNETYMASLTYRGRDGRVITRPPGLGDIPGGASIAGALTAFLGLALLAHVRSKWTVVLLPLVAVGFAAIYLTQVRSILMMVVAAVAVLAIVAFRQGRAALAASIATVGGGLIAGAFFWASAVGGSVVDDRFLNIAREGALETYRINRGGFVTATLGELLDQYPLGAGVGRWGMMQQYFGDPADTKSRPIHVEIQMTGWLLDGGIPMWLLYGGALLASMLASWRFTGSRDPSVAELATYCFPLQVFIAGLTMTGPVFNTQLGILFWISAAVLHGINQRGRAADHAEVEG